MLPTARGPSTRAGQKATSTGGNRSRSARITSSLASESRPAMTPTQRGKAGSGGRRPGSVRPSASSRRSTSALRRSSSPSPVGRMRSAASCRRPFSGQKSACGEVHLDQLTRARVLVGRRHLLPPDAAIEHRSLVGEREVGVAARRDVPALDLALDPATPWPRAARRGCARRPLRRSSNPARVLPLPRVRLACVPAVTNP